MGGIYVGGPVRLLVKVGVMGTAIILGSAALVACSDGAFKAVTGGSASFSSWNAPFPAAVVAEDCYNNPLYNMCLIYKNPVYVRGSAFSPKLTPLTSNGTLERQFVTLGLNVPTEGYLENIHFKMADPLRAVARAGGWKFPYEDDTSAYLAQVQSFYWANRQLTYMKERTGKFYFERLAAPIRAYSLDEGAQNNAYFDGSGITMGFINTAQGKVQVGLDASVLAHEIGHGNLYEASNGAGLSGCNGAGCFCATKNGCFGGIHEGQGDIHSFILFPENSVIGEYFMNATTGLRAAASIKARNLTAQDLFDLNGGEIHDMGEVYASIWWEVWSPAKAGGSEKKIEVIFTNHLAGLGTNDTFTTALDVITTMAQQIYPAEATAIENSFKSEYNRMGVTLP